MTSSIVKGRIALIDADVVVYRAAFTAERTVYDVYVDNEKVQSGIQKAKDANELMEMYEGEGKVRRESRQVVTNKETAIKACNSLISNAKKKSLSETVKCFISGDSNFRDKVATILPYKGHREDLVKPYYHQDVKEYILETYDCDVSDNCEADDRIAMTLYKEYLKSSKTKDKDSCLAVCCSIDKDLRTVPGWHFHLVKHKLDWVTNKDAADFFWQQMLMGDKADNIPGIKGVGPATASKALKECTNNKNRFLVVSKYYKKHYGEDKWLDALIEVGRLLHMQRYEGELWKPKEDWIAKANE